MSIWKSIKALFSGSVPSPSSPVTSVQATASAPTKARIVFRATSPFLARVRADLERPHRFAAERVGFITARAARGEEGLVILAEDYHPVDDEDYIDDPSVGAMVGQEGFRKALELALLGNVSVFHVHMHGPSRRLWFSGTDLREQAKFVPDFFGVCPNMPHGAVVLESRTAAGRIWLSTSDVRIIDEFNQVGPRTTVTRANPDGSTDFYT